MHITRCEEAKRDCNRFRKVQKSSGKEFAEDDRTAFRDIKQKMPQDSMDIERIELLRTVRVGDSGILVTKSIGSCGASIALLGRARPAI